MNTTEHKFAIIGLGFIAERHIRAIEHIGGKLICACDIDKEKLHKLPEQCPLFTDYKQMIIDPIFKNVDYVIIATPNYLHYEMTKDCVKAKKKVILEKPAFLHKEQYDEFGDEVNVVMQLRYLDELKDLLTKIKPEAGLYKSKMEVIVRRDDWYWDSWKGNDILSGGLLWNIGVHYFDLMSYILGEPKEFNMRGDSREANGEVVFKCGPCKWRVSLNAPMDNQRRIFEINGYKLKLNKGIETLHNKVYEEIVKGNGIHPKEIKATAMLINKLYESCNK